MEGDAEYLATLAAMGVADDAQRNTLAAIARDAAMVVAKLAVRRRLLRACDVDDVAQKTVLRVLASLDKWQVQKGGWKTFVGRTAWFVIADERRGYARDAELVAALRDMVEDEEE